MRAACVYMMVYEMGPFRCLRMISFVLLWANLSSLTMALYLHHGAIRAQGSAAIPLSKIMWAHTTILCSSSLCAWWANAGCLCVYDGAWNGPIPMLAHDFFCAAVGQLDVMTLNPYPNFPLFFTLLFALLATPLFTRSLTRRSDRHQITWQVTWWTTWLIRSQLSHAITPQSAVSWRVLI